jgi:hypothetical protein
MAGCESVLAENSNRLWASCVTAPRATDMRSNLYLMRGVGLPSNCHRRHWHRTGRRRLSGPWVGDLPATGSRLLRGGLTESFLPVGKAASRTHHSIPHACTRDLARRCHKASDTAVNDVVGGMAKVAHGPDQAIWWPVTDGRVLPRGPRWPEAPAVSAQLPLMIGTTATGAKGRSHSVWQTRRAPRGWPTRESAIHQRRCCLGPPGIAMLVLVFDIESRVVNGSGMMSANCW